MKITELSHVCLFYFNIHLFSNIAAITILSMTHAIWSEFWSSMQIVLMNMLWWISREIIVNNTTLSLSMTRSLLVSKIVYNWRLSLWPLIRLRLGAKIINNWTSWLVSIQNLGAMRKVIDDRSTTPSLITTLRWGTDITVYTCWSTSWNLNYIHEISYHVAIFLFRDIKIKIFMIRKIKYTIKLCSPLWQTFIERTN